MHTLNCVDCGIEFNRLHNRKYCTKKSLSNTVSSDRRPILSITRCVIIMTPKPCMACGETIYDDSSVSRVKLYCDDRCRQSARRRRLGMPEAKSSKPRFTPLSRKRCQVCASAVYVGGNRWKRMYCNGCLSIYGHDGCKKAARGDLETNCLNCGVLFSRLPNSGAVTCSAECSFKLRAASRRKSKAYRNSRIRCKETSEKFDPFDVFERDEWHCRICGKQTPIVARGTNQGNSPELDHIIPLSKGGTHTMSNTQCLCRKCNILKSDKLEPSQTVPV